MDGDKSKKDVHAKQTTKFKKHTEILNKPS